MIIFSKSDAEFVKKELGPEYLSEKNANIVLGKIDELIALKGFDSEYALNPFGREAQQAYDSVLSLN